MTLLGALRPVMGGSRSGGPSGRGLRARLRRVIAAVLGAVVAAGTAALPTLPPAAVAAGGAAAAVVAASVAAAVPANAATSPPVLVLLQNGETTAPETTVLQAAGYTVTQATPSVWEGMSASQFEQYAALVIGDPSSGGSCSALTPTTATSGSDAIGTAWQGAVSGNLAVIGTAPARPGGSAAGSLISDSVGYAAAKYNSAASGTSSSGTGLYVSLNCEYSGAAAGTSVPLLNGVQGIGAAGGVSVQGGLACSDPGTVNRWEAAAPGTFGGFTSADLAASAWPSSCPVEEAFGRWPAEFTPVAYDGASDATANFTASDGQDGQPYILLGAPVSTATAALAQSTGGEVPAGTTAGGGANPAAPGVQQAIAAGSVNTENGDFTQSSADVSIPGFGPGLDFTRTYDADAAKQETAAGTPGAMGYGWTDNWASTLTKAEAAPGDIYGIDGQASGNGNGGPGPQSVLYTPYGVYTDGSGNVYIADTMDNRVQEVAAATGTQWGISMTAGDIYTVAGSATGQSGASANGTPAAQSLLNEPDGVAVNSSGLYISDWNCRVAEIAATTGTQWGIAMTAGDMYVIAGQTGTCGTGADNEPATKSDLDEPGSLHFGAGSHAGDLYIADTDNNRIQEIASANETEWGQSMTAGDVYTVAGSATGMFGDSAAGRAATSALLDSPQGISLDSAGNLYVADALNDRILEIPAATGSQWNQSMTKYDIYDVAGVNGSSGVGGDNTIASQSDLDHPTSVMAWSGNLYIADTYNNRVQEVAGSAHTEFGQSMTADDVYTVAGSAAGTAGTSGNGGAATSALLDWPSAVWLDGSGDLYIAEANGEDVREVSAATSDISDVAGNGDTGVLDAGDGGAAVDAGLSNTGGIASDAHGDIFIADSWNFRVQEVATYNHTQFGIAMTGGDVYTVAGSAKGYYGDSGDGGPATSALLSVPESVVVDSAGNLYISDSASNQVREVSAATGYISTIAGSTAGTSGDSGNGGPAASALLDEPTGVTVDGAGDVFLTEQGSNQVQEIPAASGTYYGIAMTKGDIYIVAGNSAGTSGDSGDGAKATSALLDEPGGLAVDTAGDIYISDSGNSQIREIAATSHVQWGQSMTAGDIYTVAGSTAGTSGDSGDGGPAASALLAGPTAALWSGNYPQQLAVDAAGDLFITDLSNNKVREIAAANGVQWGQSMSAGDIYDVAGSEAGTAGSSGNGGSAVSAQLDDPAGVVTDPAGNLYVASDGRVQEVPATAYLSIPAAPGQTSSLYPAPGGETVTQPGGAQVTFYGQVSGICAAPYVTAGQYCVLPQDQGATLDYDSEYGSSNFTPSPGADTYVYAWTGQLAEVYDPAGDALTITYDTPAPGSGDCPSSATSCQTVTAASGRALVIGSNSNGLITSVTDPMGRTWTYAYNSSEQLTSATDPMGHVTSYTYGEGSTGNPLLASALLTVTGPNAQPGGPDAGDATVNVYDATGRVISQTDPMGFKTTLNYCVNAVAGNCLDPATGTGDVTVADPDGNSTVYDYDQGTVAAESQWTGTTLTSEQDDIPDTTAASTANPSGGSLLDSTSMDGDGNTVTTTYNADGDPTSSTSPSPVSGTAVTTAAYTSGNQEDCSGDALAASTATCAQDPGPTPVAPGGVITPPAAAPPEGLTYALFDTDGNQLYSTTGVYPPGSTTVSYLKTAYNLFNGNTVTLNGTTDSCAATAPSPSLPCATINADGVVIQLAYDSAGDLTSSSTADGNGSQDAVATAVYDADGESISATAPDGNVPGADAGNYSTVTVWNADGEQTSSTQAGGSGATVTPRVTSYGYDADGNRTTVTDARGYVTTTAYNPDDEATLLTDPDGDATLTCYDGDGNAVQTVPPAGVAAASLTAASCPTAYPAGYSDRLAADATVTTWNALGKQTQVTAPAPAGQSGYETTTYSYDANGNLAQSTAPSATDDGPDQVTVDTYNSAEQLASQTTGYGTTAAATTTYCYDPGGAKTAVVAPDGNASGTAACQTGYPWTVSASAYPAQAAYQTTYSYDSAGDRVATTTPATAAAPAGATTTATYDPAGNVLTSTDPDGVTTTFTYTPGGQPATVSYSGSAAAPVTYTYDADGNITGTSDATGTSAYQYDPFGELTGSTSGSNESVAFSYNVDGEATAITYPLPAAATWAKSDSVSYGYNNADQLTSFTDFNGNTTSITSTADGLPAVEKLGNTGDTITASYDSTDSPSAISLANSASTLQSFSYDDAPAGNILTETDTPSSATSPASYGYDGKGRVTSETVGSQAPKDYGYDASGNLTALPSGGTGTYDHDAELTTASQSGLTTSYTYSAEGERLSATQGSSTTASATWNGAQELTGYDDDAAQMSGATYQGNGLRASATFTPAGGSSVTENYLWAGETLLMDSVNAYIYGESRTNPAEQVNLATGTVTYLVTDSLGSVRGTVNSSGALTGTTSYDAWGNPQTSGGLTATTPFGFAGGYTDPDGLIYLVNRYYDPATGQFMSVDPDLAQTQQPYQYTGDNPVNETDPTGDSSGVTENTYYLNNCHVPSCTPNGCTEPEGSVSYQSPFDVSGTGCSLVASEAQDAITLDVEGGTKSDLKDGIALFSMDPAACAGATGALQGDPTPTFADCIDPQETIGSFTTSSLEFLKELLGAGDSGSEGSAGSKSQDVLWIAKQCFASTLTKHCTWYMSGAYTLFVIGALSDAIEGGQTCSEIAEMLPAVGDAIGAACMVFTFGAMGVRAWYQSALNASGGLGTHTTVWYFRVAWWWFGVHYSSWVPDWFWIYPNPNN
jgi:RHS repeat-associated protein